MIRRLPIALLAVASIAACNSITGINNITLATGGGGGGTPQIVYLAADAVSITEVAIYQGPKRSMVGGMPSPGGIVTPVIAGRDALVRVFTKVDPAYDKSEVTARLTIGKADPLELKAVVKDSIEAEFATTFNFEVPGNLLLEGVEYQVELLQPSDRTKGDNKAARHPAEGTESLDVQSSGPAFKLMLLPVKYGADGSNRLPDTSEEQIEGFKQAFYKTYPARAIEFVMHEPMQWNQSVQPNGAGWSEVLDAVAQFRIQEGTPKDTYVFGFFNPKNSFSQYCQGGCVAGLGMVGESATDNYSKAAVGLGFPGYNSFSTAIHEVGHTQGRQHADCGGAQNIDKKFPYPDAGIGVWGYDLVEKKLIQPEGGKDMMGYCDPYWVSDYTYKAIFDRMRVVNNADIHFPEELRDKEWERARVEMDGSLTWLTPLKMATPPSGRATPVTVLKKGDASVADGHFIAYDHIPGGVVLWQKDAAPIHGIQVTLDGSTKSLPR